MYKQPVVPHDLKAFLPSPAGTPLREGRSPLRAPFCLLYESLFFSLAIPEVCSETHASPAAPVNPQPV